MGPSIGLCDAMRLGYDVSSTWDMPLNSPAWPAGNCSIVSAAISAIWRQWMHQRWWQNDPDCLVVRNFPTQAEMDCLSEVLDKPYSDTVAASLSDEEAGFWVRLVWLLGGMALVSENISRLSPARYALLEKSFPLNPYPARLVDWYSDENLVILKSGGDQPVLGAFNLGDEPVQIQLPAALAGLPESWTLRERLSGEQVQGEGGRLQLPELPPHAGRLWELVF